MTKPRLKTLAAGGIASVTLLVAAAAYAADIGQLKDATGKGVRTGFNDCVQTSGAGADACAAAAAPAAQPAAASSAAPTAAPAAAAAATTAAGPASASADRNHVGGGGGAVRTGAGDCLHTGAGGGGAECGSGTKATAAAEAAKPAGGAAAPAAGAAAPAVAGATAGVAGAGHDATAGHLRDGHGSPVRIGNGKDCVNLGTSSGKDHPADCVIQAPVAKTPEPPAAAAAAAVPAPEKAPATPAPAAVATVPTGTEGVNADSVTDPTTKWSKQGAPAATPAPAAEAPAAVAEAPAAGVPAEAAPYPAPMPTFPEIEAPAAAVAEGPREDAPPYEVPGPSTGGGQPEVALVPTDPMQAGDGATDPATKWSKEGAPAAAAQPAEGSTQLPQDSVGGAPVAAPEPAQTPEPVGDLKSPDPYQAPGPAAVPAPEKVAKEEAAPAPTPPAAEPEKVPAPEYEKFVLQADALFKFDRYTRKYMLPEGKQKLDELAASLNRYSGVEAFNVIGHTDRIGSHKYNDRLSLRRAATVKQYLAEKGVDANLMKISGKGKRQPVVNCPGKKVTAKLKACLQPNRRVEVEVRGERKK